MKNHLTGSNVNLAADLEEGIDSFKLESLFDTLVESLLQYETEKKVYTLHPPDDGFSCHWFVNAKTRMLERFSKSTQVEVLEDHDHDSYLCYAGGMTIIVNKNKVKSRIID